MNSFVPNAFHVSALFPLRDNARKPFEKEELQAFRRGVMELSSAFTEVGTVVGHWQEYTDRNRWLFWIVPTTEEVTKLRSFVLEMKTVFRQEAMFFEVTATYYEAIK